MVTARRVKRRATERRASPKGSPQKMRWQSPGSPPSSVSSRSVGTLLTTPSPSCRTTARTPLTFTVPS